MPHKTKKLILDILISCEEIQTFTNDKSFADFSNDRLLQLAVEREFEIVGEAFSRFKKIDPLQLEKSYPAYRKIIGLRNIIAHGYDIIDDELLWDVIQNRVPELIAWAQNYPVE